jgi:uncharacterized protein (DUF1778 family)
MLEKTSSLQQVIEMVITLSQKDADKVFSLIQNPPKPNTTLKAAAVKHQEFFRENKV